MDVGGYAYYWDYLPARPRIVIVNLDLPAAPDPRFDWVSADARALPFRDRAFDVAFSNSVLEHIEALEPVIAEVARILRPGGDPAAAAGCHPEHKPRPFSEF